MRQARCHEYRRVTLALTTLFVVSWAITFAPAAASANVLHGVWGRVQAGFPAQLYDRGGFFMHLLVLCAVVAIVLVVERLWTLRRARINTRQLMLEVVRALHEEGPRAAMHACERTPGPIANILHAGLLRAPRGPEAVEKTIHSAAALELASLERGLLALATVSNAALLLGFLGTVTAMSRAFAAIEAANGVSPRMVTKGIEEALVVMAAGLVIAVPVAAFRAYFALALDRFVLEMEGASSELVDELTDIDDRPSSPHPGPPVVES